MYFSLSRQNKNLPLSIRTGEVFACVLSLFDHFFDDELLIFIREVEPRGFQHESVEDLVLVQGSVFEHLGDHLGDIIDSGGDQRSAVRY